MLHFCLDTAPRSMVREGCVDHLLSEVNCSCLKRPDKHPRAAFPFCRLANLTGNSQANKLSVSGWLACTGSCLLCLLFLPLPQAAHFCLRGPSISTRPLSLPRPYHLSFLFSPKPLFSPPHSLTSHTILPPLYLDALASTSLSIFLLSFFLKLLIRSLICSLMNFTQVRPSPLSKSLGEAHVCGHRGLAGIVAFQTCQATY
jgi:hypothetical protein